VRNPGTAGIHGCLAKAETDALSRAIAAVPVAAAKLALRFALIADGASGADFSAPLDSIEELTEIVLEAVRQLQRFESLGRIRELDERLQAVADRTGALIQGIVNGAY